MSAVLNHRNPLVPLMQWGMSKFPTKPPHRNTLLKWTHEGRIHPQPEKVGKCWFVAPSAEYQAD